MLLMEKWPLIVHKTIQEDMEVLGLGCWESAKGKGNSGGV